MGIVLLVMVVGICCLLLPLLIVSGISRSKEDGGRVEVLSSSARLPTMGNSRAAIFKGAMVVKLRHVVP